MNTFHLEITAPDKAFYSDEVQELVIKTPCGEIGILKGHIPMAAAVSVCHLKIKKDDKWINAFASDGFMEVTAEKTAVLVDSAEWPEEIDIDRAKAAEERARKSLDAQSEQKAAVKLQAALERALWRQKVSKIRNS